MKYFILLFTFILINYGHSQKCEDKLPNLCEAMQEYCASHMHFNYLREMCPYTCQQCHNDCKDHVACAAIKKIGGCDRTTTRYDWGIIQRWCPRSCGLCKDKNRDPNKKQKEAEDKKKAEDAKKKAAEDAKKEEARKRAEEAKKRADAEAKKKAAEEAKKRANEDGKKKADEKARKLAEEAKKKAEEEAKKKAEESKKKAEEDALKRAEEAKKKADMEAKKKAAEEAKQKENEEAKKKAEEEAKEKAEEDKKKEEEEEAKKKAEEKKKEEEEEARKKADDEKKKEEEEEAKRKADEDKKKENEEEEKKKAEENKKKEEAEEAKKKAEEEKKKEEEDEAKKKAEAEKKKAEERMDCEKSSDMVDYALPNFDKLIKQDGAWNIEETTCIKGIKLRIIPRKMACSDGPDGCLEIAVVASDDTSAKWSTTGGLDIIVVNKNSIFSGKLVKRYANFNESATIIDGDSLGALDYLADEKNGFIKDNKVEGFVKIDLTVKRE
uniref:ShKT domain-containing protein n=1 Tax=Bursaphelenchus xylophilus TaxID=6326 RepID=A0A1I7SL43_BURXY